MSKSQFTDRWIKGSAFRGLSIQQRLPLLICILLLCVMVAFSWISYINVKKAALKAGRERLNSLSDQLGAVLSQSAQAYVEATRSTTRQAALQTCLQELEPGVCTSALDLLDKVRQDTMSVVVDLLDSKKRRVLRSAKTNIESHANFDSLNTLYVGKDTSILDRIVRVGDSAFYPIIVPINANQQISGYVVRWRIVTANPRSIEQFAQLLGANATLYVGNADGSAWTDMVKPIDSPIPQDAQQNANIFEYTNSKGSRVMGSQRVIKNSHWAILIEFSEKNILAQANSYLKWTIIIGSLLMGVSIFIAWMMSRNITRPLKELTAAVSAIASGNYSSVVAVERRDEVGKLARAFNAMTIQVRKAKDELEQKIKETEQMNEQLRNLSAHLQNVREQERIHIAREMHDELGQLLTGYKMDVAWLNRKMASNADPAIKEKLESMLMIVDESVSFVRRIAAELRPSILDDLGLVPALEWHSKEFQKRFNIEVEFNAKIQDIKTSEVVATGLFRMYQESLTNVARHSGAKKVIANLQKTTAQLCLSITDDGRGFSINGNGERKTLGLLGMKERAVMIGGRLEILSEPGKGTTVIITVPSNGVTQL